MSLTQRIHLDRLGNYLRTRTPLQLGALAAGLSAVAVGGYFLFPYLRIELSVVKGWFLTMVYGTPEDRLLKHVLDNATRGDPTSVINTIDSWCWTTQWMMNVGDVKGVIVDDQVEKASPMVRITR
jgi:hypothetical protein